MAAGRLSRAQRILQRLTVSAVATLVVFGAAEGVLRVTYFVRNSLVKSIPLPYVIGDNYGPWPPWADGVRLLEPDELLFWRNHPGVRRQYIDVFSPMDTEAARIALYRRFSPSAPASLLHNPTWDIAVNSRGFRGAEFDITKPPSRLRIVCLGDSWTFGANVGQSQTYPKQLQNLFDRAFRAADVEVLNLGVLGYSSFQGLELLRRQALALHPDAVVIGFGMNDSKVSGYRDKDLPRPRTLSPIRRLAEFFARSEVYRFLRYIALSVRYAPTPLGERIKAADARDAESTSRAAGTPDGYAKLEQWTRVSLPDYERNLTDMIALSKSHGATVVVMFNELWAENPYRAAATRVARATGVPFVDSPELIARAKQQIEAELERSLHLEGRPERAEPSAANEVEVIFRVRPDGRPVPRALYIVGAHSALGELVPNRVAMHDDGTHGDQSAGDGVWSYAARLPVGAQLSYVYTSGGREGRWEGLDLPALRHVSVDGPAGRTVYRPIESFGRLYMQADGWHTDAVGYQLIARAVFDRLTASTRLSEKLVVVASGAVSSPSFPAPVPSSWVRRH